MHNLLCRVARLLRIDDPAYPMARTVFYELLEVPSSFPDDVKIFQHHQIEITAPTGECLVLIDRSSGNDHAYSARSNSGVTVINRETYDQLKELHKQHITCSFDETRYGFVYERNAMEVIVSSENSASVQVHQNGHTITFPHFLKVGNRVA